MLWRLSSCLCYLLCMRQGFGLWRLSLLKFYLCRIVFNDIVNVLVLVTFSAVLQSCWKVDVNEIVGPDYLWWVWHMVPNSVLRDRQSFFCQYGKEAEVWKCSTWWGGEEPLHFVFHCCKLNLPALYTSPESAEDCLPSRREAWSGKHTNDMNLSWIGSHSCRPHSVRSVEVVLIFLCSSLN